MHGCAFSVLLVVLAMTPPLRADEWVPPVPEDCPASPADPAAARALAGELYRSAAARGEEGAFDDSVRLFLCSYAVVPHPNTLYNLGLAAEHAGDLATAEGALARCIAEAPDAGYRAQADELLASVRERLAQVAPPPPPPPPPPPAQPGKSNGISPKHITIAKNNIFFNLKTLLSYMIYL